MNRPAFVGGLRHHGDRLAVFTPTDTLTYRQLADRVEQLAHRIGGGRRVVLVETANDTTFLVGSLAALHGGHVPLLAPRADSDQLAALTDRFDPDVVVHADGVRHRRSASSVSAHRLHAELALLTTSGSTCTPRLVRLSSTAIDANAAAIAGYLEITADDHTALNLPIHYCYGLSVVNSNLLRGAAVAAVGRLGARPGVLGVRPRPPGHRPARRALHVRPARPRGLRRHGPAAPAVRHPGRRAPRARAGPPLGGDRTSARLAAVRDVRPDRGHRPHGLPAPDRLDARPGAIGVAIPGGTLTVDRPDGDGVGELVYRGPNVMLGYADGPADLARGRTVDALHTGDLGRVRDGLFEVVGRRSRFVKPFGVRTDLDGLEHLLARHDVAAACAGTDTASWWPRRPRTGPRSASWSPGTCACRRRR